MTNFNMKALVACLIAANANSAYAEGSGGLDPTGTTDSTTASATGAFAGINFTELAIHNASHAERIRSLAGDGIMKDDIAKILAAIPRERLEPFLEIAGDFIESLDSVSRYLAIQALGALEPDHLRLAVVAVEAFKTDVGEGNLCFLIASIARLKPSQLNAVMTHAGDLIGGVHPNLRCPAIRDLGALEGDHLRLAVVAAEAFKGGVDEDHLDILIASIARLKPSQLNAVMTHAGDLIGGVHPRFRYSAIKDLGALEGDHLRLAVVAAEAFKIGVDEYNLYNLIASIARLKPSQLNAVMTHARDLVVSVDPRFRYSAIENVATLSDDDMAPWVGAASGLVDRVTAPQRHHAITSLLPIPWGLMPEIFPYPEDLDLSSIKTLANSKETKELIRQHNAWDDVRLAWIMGCVSLGIAPTIEPGD